LGKYKVFSGKELCALLQSQGFFIVRQKGSHVILQKEIEDSTITVPVPAHKEIKIGTLASIIRQSKINRELFEK